MDVGFHAGTFGSIGKKGWGTPATERLHSPGIRAYVKSQPIFGSAFARGGVTRRIPMDSSRSPGSLWFRDDQVVHPPRPDGPGGFLL
jgi:hypothetical protein